MRKQLAAIASALLVAALLVPEVASARRTVVVGSLTIAGVNIQNAIVAMAVVSNPGLEKTIVQQMPPFTVPVVVDADLDDVPKPRVLGKNLDTTVIITNLIAAPVGVTLIVRDGDGQIIGTLDVSIPGNGTRAVSLADALNL